MTIKCVECYYLEQGLCDDKYRNFIIDTLSDVDITFFIFNEDSMNKLIQLGVKARLLPIFVFLDDSGNLVRFATGLLKPIHIRCEIEELQLIKSLN